MGPCVAELACIDRKEMCVTLSLEDKKAIVTEVSEVAAQAHALVGAEYRGLTVGDMAELRQAARKAGVYLKVVRNTLARRAVTGTGFECVQEVLVGPLLLAFSIEEPGSAARLIKDFAKTHSALVTKVVAFGGKLYDPGDLDALSKLPTREEALSQLMAVMKAPVGKLARTLAEPHAKLVRTVAAVREQKQAA